MLHWITALAESVRRLVQSALAHLRQAVQQAHDVAVVTTTAALGCLAGAVYGSVSPYHAVGLLGTTAAVGTSMAAFSATVGLIGGLVLGLGLVAMKIRPRRAEPRMILVG